MKAWVLALTLALSGCSDKRPQPPLDRWCATYVDALTNAASKTQVLTGEDAYAREQESLAILQLTGTAEIELAFRVCAASDGASAQEQDKRLVRMEQVNTAMLDTPVSAAKLDATQRAALDKNLHAYVTVLTIRSDGK